MSTLEELLGIDPESPEAIRAEHLVLNDRALLRQLVAIRKEQGLTQATVGEIMGISQPAVADFEAHDSNPTLSRVRRYAHAIGALVHHKVEKDEGQLLDERRSEWVPASIPNVTGPKEVKHRDASYTLIYAGELHGAAGFRGAPQTSRQQFALAS